MLEHTLIRVRGAFFIIYWYYESKHGQSTYVSPILHTVDSNSVAYSDYLKIQPARGILSIFVIAIVDAETAILSATDIVSYNQFVSINFICRNGDEVSYIGISIPYKKIRYISEDIYILYDQNLSKSLQYYGRSKT